MRKLAFVALAALSAMGLTACSEQTQDSAKQTADSAGNDVGKAADQAGNAIEEGANKVGDAVENAADKTGDAARNVGAAAEGARATAEADMQDESVSKAKRD